MKRKLISYELFENIQSSALSVAEKELKECETIIADVLGFNETKLISFNTESALYESSDGSYIHASYELGNKKIKFDNIEQLVLDESTELNAAKSKLEEMMDFVLEGEDEKANEKFSEFFSLSVIKRNLNENCKKGKKNKKKLVAGNRKNSGLLLFKSKTEKEKTMKEWFNLSNNVIAYSKASRFGNLISESDVSRDEKGNIVSLSVPNTEAKKEAKLLTFNWKTLDTDVKVLRSGSKKLTENSEFCKAISNVKRLSTLSDDRLNENLEEIVGRWPNVLYLTHNELSSIVKECLEITNTKNYDDSTCDVLAESLLKTAHNAYQNKVCNILNLAGQECDCESETAFEHFVDVTSKFYHYLDESAALEMQVYVDLYDTLKTVYHATSDNTLRNETSSYLKELSDVIEQRSEPNPDLAFSAAEFINNLVETNLETKPWEPESVHVTVNGDHPKTYSYAKQSYSPAQDASGDEKVDDIGKDSWGNVGGEDTFPSLKNPYLPKSFGDYKVEDDGLSQNGGSEMWPELNNPYVKKATNQD